MSPGVSGQVDSSAAAGGPRRPPAFPSGPSMVVGSRVLVPVPTIWVLAWTPPSLPLAASERWAQPGSRPSRAGLGPRSLAAVPCGSHHSAFVPACCLLPPPPPCRPGPVGEVGVLCVPWLEGRVGAHLRLCTPSWVLTQQLSSGGHRDLLAQLYPNGLSQNTQFLHGVGPGNLGAGFWGPHSLATPWHCFGAPWVPALWSWDGLVLLLGPRTLCRFLQEALLGLIPLQHLCLCAFCPITPVAAVRAYASLSDVCHGPWQC